MGMNNTKTVKQTAANNKFLANVKRCMNCLVYAKCLSLVNTEGMDVAAAYVGKHFRESTREAIVAELLNGTFDPMTFEQAAE